MPPYEILGLRTLIEKTLKLSGQFNASEHAELLKEYSKCLYALGRYGGMVIPAQQAVELAQKASNTKILAQCLIWKGTVLRRTVRSWFPAEAAQLFSFDQTLLSIVAGGSPIARTGRK